MGFKYRARLRQGLADQGGHAVLHDTRFLAGNVCEGFAEELRVVGVVIVRGGGADDAVRALDVLRVVTDVYLDAFFDQLVGRDGRVHVRAGDGHAHAAQHEAERTHRYAADADQVNIVWSR